MTPDTFTDRCCRPWDDHLQAADKRADRLETAICRRWVRAASEDGLRSWKRTEGTFAVVGRGRSIGVARCLQDVDRDRNCQRRRHGQPIQHVETGEVKETVTAYHDSLRIGGKWFAASCSRQGALLAVRDPQGLWHEQTAIDAAKADTRNQRLAYGAGWAAASVMDS